MNTYTTKNYLKAVINYEKIIAMIKTQDHERCGIEVFFDNYAFEVWYGDDEKARDEDFENIQKKLENKETP
uniref:Uncharacterized protein n=1 Tax=viral metagenome TaxID=1070528 RepID=A0A6M3M0U0_9ZZZZ